MSLILSGVTSCGISSTNSEDTTINNNTNDENNSSEGTIFIRTLQGKAITMDYDKKMRIGDIKQKIFEKSVFLAGFFSDAFRWIIFGPFLDHFLTTFDHCGPF